MRHKGTKPPPNETLPPADARPLVSTAALVVFNFIPLWGVLFHGWDVFTVLLLFWFESFIIGGFNIARMAIARGDGGSVANGHLAKLFLIPFFIVHYGIFLSVHGLFIFTLFGARGPFATPPGQVTGVDGQPLALLPNTSGIEIAFAFLGLCVSHGVSFVTNYVGRGEYRTATVRELMMQPYGRVVVLHLTVLFGGIAVSMFGAAKPAIALLALLKIGMDLRGHWAERRRLGRLDRAHARIAVEGADAP